jgi:hypothetical protein
MTKRRSGVNQTYIVFTGRSRCLSNYWRQKSDIWSQDSYRHPISWEVFFDPSDSYFLFAEERGYHKWALAHSLSCFSRHIQNVCSMCIKINKIGKQEVGIWWVQKRFPRYGVHIWSLWPNIRSQPSIVAEKNVKLTVYLVSLSKIHKFLEEEKN